MPSVTFASLNVIIVGAGISGLAAAISCRRAGHNVELFERSGMTDEVGAAIHVPPNAARTLLAWGVDTKRFVAATKSSRVDGKTLAEIETTDESFFAEEFGAPLFYAHRVDLHEELKRLATEEFGLGKPAVLHLNSKVKSYDVKNGFIYFENGSSVFGDVIISADGVHAKASGPLLADSPQPTTNGVFAFRFMLPTADLLNNADTKDLFQHIEGRSRTFIGEGGRRILSYPCRNDAMQNFICVFQDDGLKVAGNECMEWIQSRTEKSSAANSVDNRMMLDIFHGFHPSIKAVFKSVQDAKVWPLISRAPAACWHKGRVVLIGDAAHPMLPHHGQGAAQGIEDGIAVGIALSDLQTNDLLSIGNRLCAFETIRVKRASYIQVLSQVGQEESAKVGGVVSKLIDGGNAPESQQDLNRLMFGYDVVQHSQEIISKSVPGWRLPSALRATSNTLI